MTFARITVLFSGIALFVLSFSGCLPTVDCRDVGCSDNMQCQSSTGKCVEVNGNCDENGCPEGQVCDPESGRCTLPPTECGNEACPSGQCNTQTGYCETTSSCSVGGCQSAATECDPISGSCIPLECTSDSSCPAGFICEQDVCREGCRLGEQACPNNQFCLNTAPESTVGQCAPPCETDSDCPYGQVCDSSRQPPRCKLEPPCDTNSDCRPDEICKNQRCGLFECRDQTDCPDDKICDRDRFRCIEPDCEDDLFAPNHLLEQAASVEPGIYSNLQLCPGTQDWYQIRLESSQSLFVELLHGDSRDLDMTLFDSDGRLVGINQHAEPRSTLRYATQSDRQLFIKVVGESNDAPASYTLRFEREDEPLCSSRENEPNNSRSTATSLELASDIPTTIEGNICQTDTDWYKLSGINADSHLKIANDALADGLRTRLLTPDRQTYELDSSPLEFLRTGFSGTYFLVVDSPGEANGSYQFEVNLEAPFRCPANKQTSQANPKPLDRFSSQTFSLCLTNNPGTPQWNISWYLLELSSANPGDVLDLQIALSPEVPESFTADLFKNRAGERLKSVRSLETTGSRGREGSVKITEEMKQNGLLLRTYVSESPNRIVDKPTYRISYQLY